MQSPTLKIAIQKSGRLSDDSIKLLKECGIKFNHGKNQLVAPSSNFPIEILYLRVADIPQYIADGIADLGIIGENVFLEKNENIENAKALGFSKCRLSLAIQKSETYTDLSFFEGKKIDLSLPHVQTRSLNSFQSCSIF